MVPGLLPPPHTHQASPAHPEYPVKEQLITILAHPGHIPLVLARAKMDLREAEDFRSQGAKGKVAVVLHYFGDALADLAGKSRAPKEVTEMQVARGATSDG